MITGLTLLFIITAGWYVSNMVASSILYNVIEEMTLTSEGESLVGLATFLNIIYGPVLDILVIIWMVAAAQQRDIESELYG